MKRLLLLFLTISFLFYLGQAPSDRYTSLEKSFHLDKIVSVTIIRQQGKPEIRTKDNIIIKGPDLLSEKFVLPDEALKKYGVKGAIIETLNPGVVLIPLSKILKTYKIYGKDVQLMVYVDNVKYHSEAIKILVVPTNVKAAVIATDNVTRERYIDIRTGGLLRPRHQQIKL
jgi:hypothetical protein